MLYSILMIFGSNFYFDFYRPFVLIFALIPYPDFCFGFLSKNDRFVRSGDGNMIYGGLMGVGKAADYWSNTGTEEKAYFLDFDDTGRVGPSLGPNSRYYGFSLRCLQE